MALKTIRFAALLPLLACESDADGVTSEDFVPPEELALPELDDVDIEGAFEEALARMGSIQLSPGWLGNRNILDQRKATCPTYLRTAGVGAWVWGRPQRV